MLLLYIVTIFVSAILLFLIQPLFANLVLPLLGGSPAVWNTATMFYQTVLLLGYIYAHIVKNKLSLKWQAIVHTVVILLPLVVLPIAVPSGWSPPTDSTPVLWMVGLLAVSVALPFFVLSTTSSLTQSWFARLGTASAKDPYFLYVASNIGSMIGLLGYPLLMQPLLRLREQSALWSIGYGVLAVLLLTTTWATWRRVRGAGTDALEAADVSPDVASAAPGGLRRLRWVLLAFVPSSLMLSVTTYISTDITPVPLLWVIPLALYLLTFIFVFARKQLLPPALMRTGMQVILILSATMLISQIDASPWLLIPLHLLAFFLITMTCHGQLAGDRPAARHLTEFYLWMSVGGALGGIFNALIAPAVFTSIAEYPLVLGLAALLVGLHATTRDELRRWLKPDLAFAAMLALGLSAAFLAAQQLPGGGGRLVTLGALALAGSLCFIFSNRGTRYGLGMAAVFVTGLLWSDQVAKPGLADDGAERRLTMRRSFFGINHVYAVDSFGTHVLLHGSTVHGGQYLAPERQCDPFSYYSRSNSLGHLFETRDKSLAQANIGVVGLGTGALAGYAQPGQRWTFYEIDPDVKAIAEDPKLFSYLSACAPQSKIVLGDARLQLAREIAQQPYDVLIMDAYSSDAIPIHLITKEAMQLYQSRLSADGLLIFHVSNRYFKLQPILANLAQETGMVGLRTARADFEKIDPNQPAAPAASGTTLAEWVVLARSPAQLADLARSPRWEPLKADASKPIWTDDFASLLGAFR